MTLNVERVVITSLDFWIVAMVYVIWYMHYGIVHMYTVWGFAVLHQCFHLLFCFRYSFEIELNPTFILNPLWWVAWYHNREFTT